MQRCVANQSELMVGERRPRKDGQLKRGIAGCDGRTMRV